jgi:hypothetical protein
MANSTTYQILEQGARNAIVKLTGVLDTTNVSLVPAFPIANLDPVPKLLRIDHIDYSISDQLEVQLFWNATTPALILPLAGRGKMSFWSFGGLQNNAGAGVDGQINLLTTGWTSGVQVYSIILEMVKQGV